MLLRRPLLLVDVLQDDFLEHLDQELLEVVSTSASGGRVGDDHAFVVEYFSWSPGHLLLQRKLLKEALHRVQVLLPLRVQKAHDLREELVSEADVGRLRLEDEAVDPPEGALRLQGHDGVKAIADPAACAGGLQQLILEDFDGDVHERAYDPPVVADRLHAAKDRDQQIAYIVDEHVLLSDRLELPVRRVDQLHFLIVVKPCPRMVDEEVDLFSEGRANPFDEITWVRLQQCEEYLVQLLVEADQFGHHHFDVIKFLDIWNWKSLDARRYAILSPHDGRSGCAIGTLLRLVDGFDASFEGNHQVDVLLAEVSLELALILYLQLLLDRELEGEVPNRRRIVSTLRQVLLILVLVGVANDVHVGAFVLIIIELFVVPLLAVHDLLFGHLILVLLPQLLEERNWQRLFDF